MNTAVLTQSCPTCLCALPVSEFLSAIDSLLAAERWVGEAGVTDIHNPVVRDFLPLSFSTVPPINNPHKHCAQPILTPPHTQSVCLFLTFRVITLTLVRVRIATFFFLSTLTKEREMGIPYPRSLPLFLQHMYFVTK